VLPLGFGYIEGVTHDYLRRGTTTLFAALNLLDGAVLPQCRPRHRHQEFLGFLRAIDKAVPADLDIHVILDNYAAHKHPKVKAWLAARRRWHLHFVPTYSSWLNLVERFFAHITDKAIRRGSFHSVRDLVTKIDHFVTHYNQTCKPFIWTATADSILAKLQRLCSRINGTGHSCHRRTNAVRDDFTQAVKEQLAKRAGARCSNPQCRRPTSGPQSQPTGAVNIGVAAHISAAAPQGPRYDPKLTAEERQGRCKRYLALPDLCDIDR
jgi:putative transposase